MQSTRKTSMHLGFLLASTASDYTVLISSSRGTPDSWVPRDPRLVRLTGKHPFNCEAKLNDLYAEGFLTPSNLFYVRNHGAVPKVDQEMAESWKLKIHGYIILLCYLFVPDLLTYCFHHT
jgi:nitrate reductase (NAD(P)H)